MIIAPEVFETLLPLACAWAEQQELSILELGIPLSKSEMADAKCVGVAKPECIRLLSVPQIPSPQHPILAAAAAATQLISPLTAGLTVRYGIFIREDCWGNRSLLAHECAHTMQYERMGGFDAFLRSYLRECLDPPGYPHGPLEQEALRLGIDVAGRF